MNNQSYIKPEINKEHPRIENRTPNQQKYRDDLAQVLKDYRQLGDMGKHTARVVLRNRSESVEYISAKENVPQELVECILDIKSSWIDEILEKFKGISHQKISKILLKTWKVEVIVKNLEKFQELDSEIINPLIEERRRYTIAENLEKFQGVDHNKIAKLIIENGGWYAFAENLEKVKGLNESTVDAVNHFEEEDETFLIDELEAGKQSWIAMGWSKEDWEEMCSLYNK